VRPRLEPATRIPRPPLWAVGLVALWVGLVAWTSASWAGPADAGTSCNLRRITGVPCPTCGASRGTRAILDGRPGEAWSLNPLFFSAAAVVGAFLLFRLATGRRVVLGLTGGERRLAWALALVALLAGWAYVIWRQT